MPPIRPAVYYFNVSLTLSPRWRAAGLGDVVTPAGSRCNIVGKHTLWLNDDKEPYDIRIYASTRAPHPFKLMTRYAPVFVRPLLVKLVKTKLRDAGFVAEGYEVNIEMQRVVAAEQFGRVV
jgi:hypothetical protein